MADDHIRYDILAQEALRGVMRKVLAEVARTGLPGNHHFFITFLTGAPGVRVSSRLRERYPEQMTIVIQFQYWDLKVTDTGFEVGLSFSDVPEKLEIPFSAVRGFYDPSVNFELEFDVKTDGAAADEEAGPAGARAADHRLREEAEGREEGRRRGREEARRGRGRRQGRRSRLARRLPQEIGRRSAPWPTSSTSARPASRRRGTRRSAPPNRTGPCTAVPRPRSSATG